MTFGVDLEVQQTVYPNERLKQFLDVEDDDFVDHFVRLNGNDMTKITRDNAIIPGLMIYYFIISTGTQVYNLSDTINNHGRYQIIIDYLPENEFDNLPGLNSILQKVNCNVLYDFKFKAIGCQIPRFLAEIIYAGVFQKKLKTV